MSQIKNDCQNKNHHHKGRYCLHRVLLIYRELLIICRPWTQSHPCCMQMFRFQGDIAQTTWKPQKTLLWQALGAATLIGFGLESSTSYHGPLLATV
jgi:hypothetical protein